MTLYSPSSSLGRAIADGTADYGSATAAVPVARGRQRSTNEIARTAYHTVTIDLGASLVFVTRTSERFATMLDVQMAFQTIEAALTPINRAQKSVIFDLRKGPLRNDPLFESVVSPHRKRISRGFRHRYALVATTVGKFQVMRHAAKEGTSIQVTDDALELVGWLGLKGKLLL